jgi:hypothetical protein
MAAVDDFLPLLEFFRVPFNAMAFKVMEASSCIDSFVAKPVPGRFVPPILHFA